MTGFLDVVLRGLALTAQAIAIGGVAFLILLLGPGAPDTDRRPVGTALRLVGVAAAVTAVVEVALLAVQLIALGVDDAASLVDVMGTTYFRAAAVRIVACAAVIAGARGAGRSVVSWLGLTVGATALAVTAAWMSHAAARPGARALLLALNAAHQLAAGVWIGGLGHLILTTLRHAGEPWHRRVLERFSAAMLGTVAVLVVAGTALASSYIGGAGALLGTSYGLMMLTKVAILGGLLLLGALNFVAVRRRMPAAPEGGSRIGRFVEVELGLGITALFVAASLTSLPVAVDVTTERATLSEVAARLTPRVPSLTSPAHEELPADDRDAPRTDADRGWSEYNHHVAGALVLVMGVLAILSSNRRFPWARHWPLAFVALAAFLLVRDDPGDWPLGPRGFWDGMRYPEVLQHRIFVALVIAFAVFEWMVRSGRLRSPRPALVFPLLCALGGALLLTHSHAGLNLKEEFLIEITHAPLGLLGIVVGWGRWLELRLPAGDGTLPGRLSAWSLALVGLLLLLYRES